MNTDKHGSAQILNRNFDANSANLRELNATSPRPFPPVPSRKGGTTADRPLAESEKIVPKFMPISAIRVKATSVSVPQLRDPWLEVYSVTKSSPVHIILSGPAERISVSLPES